MTPLHQQLIDLISRDENRTQIARGSLLWSPDGSWTITITTQPSSPIEPEPEPQPTDEIVEDTQVVDWTRFPQNGVSK